MNNINKGSKFGQKTLQKVLELFPEPVAIHCEGKISYANDACIKLLEAKNREEIIGKPVISFVHNSYKEFVSERIKTLKQGNELKDLVEEIFITVKGNPVYVEVAASQIEFEGKESIIVVFRDVTKKKEEQKRLLHLESLLKIIHRIEKEILEAKNENLLLKNICENLSNLKSCAFSWIGKIEKEKLNFMAYNGSEEELGVKIKSLKNNSPESLVFKENKKIYGNIPFQYNDFKEWNEICTNLNVKSFCFFPIYSGEKLWGVLAIYSFEDEILNKEELALIEELSTEIGISLFSFKLKATEKKIKNELKMSEAKIKALLNALDDIVFSLDKRGRFTFYHSKDNAITLKPSKNIFGKKYKEIMPEEFCIKMDNIFKDVLSGVSREFEYRDERKGSQIWFSVKVSPLYYKNKINGAVAISRNITEKILAEKERTDNFYKIQTIYEATIKTLANAVELRDATTFGHQQRTAKLACAIAQKLNLPKEKIEGLRLAAYVHDVGKIAIPAEILSKPGKLLPIELEIIKTHAQKGYEILKGIDFPWPVPQIVLQHSEHIDGSGYPKGLKGEELLEEAKILSVADAIDAMCSHRPYRPALPVSEVIKEIKCLSGKWYDTKVVDVAVDLLKSGFKWD